MLRLLFLFLSLNLALVGRSQTGTIGDPFTSLNQAVQANTAGIYFFNIGGVTFDTYTDANGYILIAIDFGNGVGNLPQGTSLNLSTRGILNTTVLGSITTHTEIRISSSTGNIDVTTSNATLLGRITSNTTLHTGVADNGINDFWAGTGAVNFTNNATGASPTANDLDRKIFHPSGNTNTFHWQPRINQQRETHASGEIAAGASLMLWVRDNSIQLPVELLNFNAEEHYNKTVKLNWQTASEINNDYFTIQRSKNGFNWEEVSTIVGAGNSSSILSYSTVDTNPYFGISYYRLKQTDFDGEFEYSAVRSVRIEKLIGSSVQVYPNPTNNNITIKAGSSELEKITIVNSLGQDVTTQITATESNEQGVIYIDLSPLATGMYYVKTKTTANKVYKQ